MNSRTATRTWARRSAVAGCAALALGATSLGLAQGASAAPAKGFIAAPNGIVGVSESILISAPSAKGQTVTIGVQNGSAAQTIQTVIGSNGYGAATWLPTLAGSWTISGLGNIASITPSTISVAAMPTYTTLLAANNMQQDQPNTVTAAVTAAGGTLAPSGSASLITNIGGTLATAPLSGSFGTATSTASLTWTPNATITLPLTASYNPASTASGASTSQISTSYISGAAVTVALAFPATMNVGSPTVIQAILGHAVPNGTVGFLMDGKGISGSIPTVNGVATLQWTPTVGGIHYFSAMFTSTASETAKAVSGTANQSVFINNPKPVDNITVDPPTQPAWSIAAPIVMTAGTSVTLAGAATSGSPVTFVEAGPCYINGAVLYATSPGTCQVTASSPGNATITGASETYSVTVNAAPKKKRS
jgi:hypothetical protein